jgi:hypothetical protein
MNHRSGFDSDRFQYGRQFLERRLPCLIEKARSRLAVGSHGVLCPVEVHSCRKCLVEKFIQLARQLRPNEKFVLRECIGRGCEIACHPLQQFLIRLAANFPAEAARCK